MVERARSANDPYRTFAGWQLSAKPGRFKLLEGRTNRLIMTEASCRFEEVVTG